MSRPAPAIFLSYAREDAVAARRIAEALRAHGLEVWFDENELRGGDAWDTKIRSQIRECTLFMPIVSARTQERHEGYFRREWKLAVERTADMAAGVAFVVPVVIDETRESEALVPDEFMRVQWTRLQGALPTPAFVAQVQRLIEAPRGGTRGTAATPRTEPGASPGRKVFSPAVLLGGFAIVAASVVAIVITGRKAPAPPVVPTAATTAVANAKATTVADKSIAVLPFANLSEDRDNTFFADGVHEDILTNLALVRDLKVISRTTVSQYRDSKKTLRQIGDELGVAYILEGSVRRAGTKVRVTGQLINAKTDEHVWAKNYDRDLTDIFAIQAALAQEIAGSLSAAISPETRRHLDRKPTDNPAAYDVFLRGRDTRNRAPTNSKEAMDQAEQLFRRAVELDPGFAAAWGELAVVHALNVFWERDASARRKAEGDAAIARAVELAPDAPDVIRLVGTHAYYAYRDYPKAVAQYEKIIQLQPNESTGYSSLGLIQRRQGRWREAIANLKRSVELDPANISNLRNLASTYYMVRRWNEATETSQRILTLLPGQLVEELAAADRKRDATGSMAEPEALLARLSPAERELPVTLYYRKGWAIVRDDYAEFKRLDALQPAYPELEAPAMSACINASMYFAHGDVAAARARLDGEYPGIKALCEQEPENARANLYLGTMEIIYGRADEGLRRLKEIMTRFPITRDAIDSPTVQLWLAAGYVAVGDKENALAGLRAALSVPGQNSVNAIAVNPSFAALRDDPRFKALIADPKNKAPMF